MNDAGPEPDRGDLRAIFGDERPLGDEAAFAARVAARVGRDLLFRRAVIGVMGVAGGAIGVWEAVRAAVEGRFSLLEGIATGPALSLATAARGAGPVVSGANHWPVGGLLPAAAALAGVVWLVVRALREG